MSGNKLKLGISEPQSQAGAIKDLSGGGRGGRMWRKKMAPSKICDSKLKKQCKFSGGRLFVFIYLTSAFQ